MQHNSCRLCAATVIVWERRHESFWKSLKIYPITELRVCAGPVVHFSRALFTACDVISSFTTATKWNIMKGCFVRCCFQELERPWSPRSAPKKKKKTENWNFYFSLSCMTLYDYLPAKLTCHTRESATAVTKRNLTERLFRQVLFPAPTHHWCNSFRDDHHHLRYCHRRYHRRYHCCHRLNHSHYCFQQPSPV